MLSILYEDSTILAIHKPPRIHSVSLPTSQDASIASLLLAQHPSLQLASPRPEEGGLLHRLDRDTSGILLVAKDRETWDKLHSMMVHHEITKHYHILVEGIFEHEQLVSSYIGSPYRRGKKVRIYKKDPGKSARALPATTRFEPLTIYHTQKVTLVRACAATARRHQVRAHAASLGFPLIGDSLYGSKRSLDEVLILSNPRDFFLHAEHVEFMHPLYHRMVCITAPYSLDFT